MGIRRLCSPSNWVFECATIGKKNVAVAAFPPLVQGEKETETLEIELVTHLLRWGLGWIKGCSSFFSEDWVSVFWGSGHPSFFRAFFSEIGLLCTERLGRVRVKN
ncbi:hypothetical protein VNO78_13569 [Psophocarpus tetragonolobus]|uniref:Uncharacterized protein n=1 Tax=Psophocarpus tetragonolobus TaxID=3891 RepID=A0AAN9SXR4_PSOTE